MVRTSSRLRSKKSEEGNSDRHDDDGSSSDSDVDALAAEIGNKIKEILSNSDDSDSDNDEESGSVIGQSLDFVIDKQGGSGSSHRYHDKSGDHGDGSSEETESSDEEEEEEQRIDKTSTNHRKELASRLEPNIDPRELAYVETDLFAKPKLHNRVLDKLLQGKDNDLMKKSVLTTDYEKKSQIPAYEQSLRQIKKQRRIEREKTKGSAWFNLPAPEMTDELRNDLTVLKMRDALDPKRFYKSHDQQVLPKYFQMGRIVEAPADFYHSRVPKKQRKKTLVDELLEDADFRRFNKRKYAEIQGKKQRNVAGAIKQMKRWKKKKK